MLNLGNHLQCHRSSQSFIFIFISSIIYSFLHCVPAPYSLPSHPHAPPSCFHSPSPSVHHLLPCPLPAPRSPKPPQPILSIISPSPHQSPPTRPSHARDLCMISPSLFPVLVHRNPDSSLVGGEMWLIGLDRADVDAGCHYEWKFGQGKGEGATAEGWSRSGGSVCI